MTSYRNASPTPSLSTTLTLAHLLMVLLLVIGYTSPWVISTGASLTLNAYDLAEWSSLHPMLRGTQPPLLTSLLLRIPLVCLGLMIAYLAPRLPSSRWRSLGLIAAVAAAVAILPPFEFLTTGSSSDPNYQQMLTLAVITFTGSVVLFAVTKRIAADWMLDALIILGCAAGLWGWWQSFTALGSFEVPIYPAHGFGLFLAAGVGFIYLNRKLKNRTTRSTRVVRFT